ncbi:hypothetical protein RPE78_14830 (plasmid) [Thioclava litoralis]|uniref:Uncharacterized protein n=1 Tax=Thioclava litoralis TaxID=3076557 RepID=A0ABZ1E4D4_9RHOB|nr:hypothetical protein RPE78_14830 [Thioclava sp. FTW29]
MKQLLLATALIAAPVAVFSGVEHYLTAPAAQTAGLGDLTPYATIVADTQTIAASGDLAKAETRITDLETAWDKAEPTLRPQAPAEWAAVDDAADAAFTALRAKTPDRVTVSMALASLQDTLANPQPVAATGTQTQGGIAVTDATGHPIACEVMLQELSTALTGSALAPDASAQIRDLQARAIERCNADDDRRADAFSAQALAMVNP